jgi:HEAT repeat protein
MLESPYSFLSERAARVLAEIGGQAIRADLVAILADSRADLSIRMNIAEVLGEVGDAAVAPGLLSVFEAQRGPGTDRLRGVIAKSLAALRYTQSVSAMIDAVQEMAARRVGIVRSAHGHVDSLALLYITTAIGSLGDTSLIPEIIALTQKSRNSGRNIVYDYLLPLLWQLGGDHDVNLILELTEGTSHEVDAYVALARRGHEELVIPKLLQFIRDSKKGIVITRLARSLGDYKHVKIVHLVLSMLDDPSLEWQRKWLMLDILPAYPRQEVEDDLIRILADGAIDERVRIKAAIVLAGWNNEVGLGLLRSALDADKLPYTINVEDDGGFSVDLRSGFSILAWEQVGAALSQLGAYEIVPELLSRLRAIVRGAINASYAEATALAAALVPFKPAGLAEVVASAPILFDLTFNVQGAMTKEWAPFMLQGLERGALGSTSTAYSACAVVGAYCDSFSDAERLLRLHISREKSLRYSEQLLRALERVSQRAGVRVFADGRIHGIGP